MALTVNDMSVILTVSDDRRSLSCSRAPLAPRSGFVGVRVRLYIDTGACTPVCRYMNTTRDEQIGNTYVDVHVCVHICIRACTYTYMQVSKYAYLCMRARVYVYVSPAARPPKP